MKTDWIDEVILLSDKFYAPYTIKDDSDYVDRFICLVEEFTDVITQADLHEESYREIDDFKLKVSHVMHLWYEGEIVGAQDLIDECITELVDGEVSVCELNRCPALWGYRPVDSEKGEVQLFRARSGKEFETYKAKDMFHIPFDKRSKASSERFSIPGLPCLYLGNTSYACWIEIGRPSDDRTAVAPVIVKDGVKVFNLAVSVEDMDEFKEDRLFENDTDRETKFVEYIKLMILMMASSFVVDSDQSNRSFKSEYIIPQLIMLSAKKNRLGGVTYYSTKTLGGRYANTAINVALFPTFDPDDKCDYSKELADKVYIGNATNFEMFKHINLSSESFSYNDLRIEKMPKQPFVYDGGFEVDYRNMIFSSFDNYLFCIWKRDCRMTFSELLKCIEADGIKKCYKTSTN